jgi:hypothetical protein
MDKIDNTGYIYSDAAAAKIRCKNLNVKNITSNRYERLFDISDSPLYTVFFQQICFYECK